MHFNKQTKLPSMLRLVINNYDHQSSMATHKIPVMFCVIQQTRHKSTLIQSLLLTNNRLTVSNFNNQRSTFKQIHNQKQFEAILKAPVEITPETETFGLKLGKKQKQIKLPANIVMRYCPQNEVNDSETIAATQIRRLSDRPLLILLGWLQSREEHLEKYRQFWFERGFDILSVRTLPHHLLLPGIGGRNNAIHMVEFLTNHSIVYDEILVHGLSVGGYQLGEVFNYCLENKDQNERIKHIFDSIKGIIVDSLVFAQDCPSGASRAITTNPILQQVLEKSIAFFLSATKSFTYNRYLKVQQIMFNNNTRIPGCICYSKSDVVSSPTFNIELYQGWKSRDPEHSELHEWHDAPHVLIYKKYPEQYTKVIDDFVKNKTTITKAKFKNGK